LSLSMRKKPIPVVDLFAGPGGLGEGFSSVEDETGDPIFDVRISIEKDPVAHRTLSLRALFRRFPKHRAPDAYYDYLRSDISREDLLADPKIALMLEQVTREAKCATLGETPKAEIDTWIREAIGNSSTWVLIGGPPCQAYSMVGRARMRRSDPKAFEADKRHFLYKEYLRIIQKFKPTVFVMENVKGILSSKHGESLIFERILKDLARPNKDLEYEIRSFVLPRDGKAPDPEGFIIEAERFGVPQMRHRVILFGVRSDLKSRRHHPLQPAKEQVGVLEALSGLPPLRSCLSRGQDSFDGWIQTLKAGAKAIGGWENVRARNVVKPIMAHAVTTAHKYPSNGGRFIYGSGRTDRSLPTQLRAWYYDARLGGVTQHETRAHMPSDIHRYLFASSYAKAFKMSPKLGDFPLSLLPEHENVTADKVPFQDRFRVQLGHLPSTTVVSHISKDGHYYIHPDPSQCRSLTVREAARLQTFPDNYFFEGNRTEQYVQVGNAVPPFLARQIADVVSIFLGRKKPPE